MKDVHRINSQEDTNAIFATAPQPFQQIASKKTYDLGVQQPQGLTFTYFQNYYGNSGLEEPG